MFLLDVNILIALADYDHVHHARSTHFLEEIGRDGWATCPLTENGFLRIIGHPNYPKGPGSPSHARRLLLNLRHKSGHQFWSDSLSLCEDRKYSQLPVSKHLTDYYLLALALENQAQLATLDQRIDPTLLSRGSEAYYIIPFLKA